MRGIESVEHLASGLRVIVSTTDRAAKDPSSKATFPAGKGHT